MKKALLLSLFILSLNVTFTQWQPVNNGINGGWIHSLAVDPITDYAYAGTHDGIYKSTNNGTGWLKLNNGLPTATVSALAIKDGNIFAGTAFKW